ncbi:MAG: glutamate racemase, partial [Bacteroidales bacterium]|nr:glutamate racemase [Bacteroidales bacterium]
MKEKKSERSVIGIFDSGVGGLSVWRELFKELPFSDFIYLSDNAFCPYGSRKQQEIVDRVIKAVDFLIKKDVSVIVIACNTATAAAIETLRKNYTIPFIGMEPAVKPAAIHSATGVIGVLATQATFKGKLYNNTLEHFASDVKVIQQAGAGLVEAVQHDLTDSPQT